MPTLDEILKDDKTYPNTLEVDFAGAKVPLASLRQFSLSELKTIEARKGDVERAHAEATKSRAEAIRLSQEAQKLYDSLQTTRPAASSATDDAWETDPVYAPVRGRLTEYQKKMDELDAAIKKSNELQQQITMIGAYDRWERQYDAFPKDRRPKDKSIDDLVKYATENKLNDRFGIPSVSLALDKLTESDRLDDIRKQAREEGAREAETRMRATTMPKPNYSPIPAQGKSGAPLEDLDQLTNKAMEDPELREMIQGLNLA